VAKQKGQRLVAHGLGLPIYVNGEGSIVVRIHDASAGNIIYAASVMLEKDADAWLTCIDLTFAQSVDAPTNKVLSLQVDYGGIIICGGKVYNINPNQAARIGLMLELEKR